ncbi:hypothetical protein ACHAXR_006798 [Thalassiosira sp. AJA248-18]
MPPHSTQHGEHRPPSPTGSSCSIRHTYTHLTYSRHHLIDTAMETIKIAENEQYTNSKGQTVNLKADLDYAVENSAHYEHEFDFHAALAKYDLDDGGRGIARSVGSDRGLGSVDESEKKSSDDNLASLNHSDRALKLSFTGMNNLRENRQRFRRTSFLVVSASWLESASELLSACDGSSKKIRVGVLNSASGTTPGGRFLKGTVSQEDCLCRASLLYSCISQPKFQSEGRFYGKNRSLGYGTSNCVIFSPDVPVIREDTVEGKLLDNYEKVSFVTIPAPNAFTTSTNSGKEYNDIEGEELRKGQHSRNASIVEDYTQIMSPEHDFDEKFEKKRRALLASLSDRIHRALAAFVLGNCTDLVLPAFGCGVHGNDPSMVANVFREMLTDPNQFGGRFRTVVFAVPPSRKQNYQAFAAYFQKKETEERIALTKQLSMV